MIKPSVSWLISVLWFAWIAADYLIKPSRFAILATATLFGERSVTQLLRLLAPWRHDGWPGWLGLWMSIGRYLYHNLYQLSNFWPAKECGMIKCRMNTLFFIAEYLKTQTQLLLCREWAAESRQNKNRAENTRIWKKVFQPTVGPQYGMQHLLFKYCGLQQFRHVSTLIRLVRPGPCRRRQHLTARTFDHWRLVDSMLILLHIVMI